ncbi:MAG TPA: hypothetical protein VK973_15385 [Arenicellales bacterium]|nr:hypothetical protein [Arenicellales bacterium]
MRSRTRRPRRITLHNLMAAAFVLCAWTSVSSGAEEPSASGAALRVELNKLESIDSACRAYLLFENRTAGDFASLKLDLVMFNAEGIISRRLAVEGGPLPAGKTSVKLFDIQDVACGSVSRVLLNGVLACSDASGERTDCLALIETASRSSADFFK